MAVDAAAVIFSTAPFPISGHGTSHKWPSSSPLLFAPGKGCGGLRQEKHWRGGPKPRAARRNRKTLLADSHSNELVSALLRWTGFSTPCYCSASKMHFHFR